LMSHCNLQQGGKALFRPELPSAFEAILKLGTLGFHGSAADG